jgi:predicted permease
MANLRRALRRIAALFRRRAAEDELARELAAHLALLEDEHRRRGLPPGDARAAARRAMGSVARAKDLHRDARSVAWLEDLRRDVRHAARALLRAPGFAFLAVLALGLGIGVNTTFFALVNAICLRGLPIDSPERVLYVSTRDARNQQGLLSFAEFEDLRSRLGAARRAPSASRGVTTPAFPQVGAYTNTIVALNDDRQPPDRVLGAFVSASTFELLGHRPILGRTFHPDEDRAGAPSVVIIGSEIWQSRYASDPEILGETVTVSGVPATVIGVMPRGFMFPANADLWRPLAAVRAEIRESRAERRLAVFARLAPAATEAQARAETTSIAAAWARDFPETNRDVQLDVKPINEQLNPSVMQRAWIAFITAGMLVLLVACANVANLLLMRGAARGQEIAIRASIGATRGRVVRQLLTEGAVLAGLAGLAGVAMAWAGLRVLAGMVPPETLPYWMAFAIDARVLAVTAAVCLGCVFVCGLPSALHVSRVDLRATLTEGSSTILRMPARRWVSALLALEFAAALVLMSLAVMSLRLDAARRQAEFQIDPTALVTMWLTLPADAYRAPGTRAAFFDRLDEAIQATGSIGSIGLTSALPYGGGQQRAVQVRDAGAGARGSGFDAGEDPAPTATVISISERYLTALGVPLRRGRAFTRDDGRPGREAALVNERFVQLFLRGREPIGALVRIGDQDPWVPIVGVATTVRQQAVGTEPGPVVFLPVRASPPATTILVARTAGKPGDAVGQLRRAVERIDSNVPLYRVMTFEESVRNASWNGRLSDAIIKSIAAVALVLATVGLYAVTGYTVERWRRELALRVALGAKARQVGWLVVRRLLMQLAIGLGIGLMLAVPFDRAFNEPAAGGGVGMLDPGALLITGLGIAGIAMIACVIPVRRAVRLDPLASLRAE